MCPFYVPVYAGTIGREPGQVLLTPPWTTGLTLVAGDPRAGVLAASRAWTASSYLQPFDVGATLTLGTACEVPVTPLQLLAAGGDQVLVIAEGRALRVTLAP